MRTTTTRPRARLPLAAAALLLLLPTAGAARAQAPAADAAVVAAPGTRPGLSALVGAPGAVVRGVATAPGAVSVDEHARQLRARGIRTQPLRHLPLLLVAGTVPQLTGAVRDGVVADVYPDAGITLASETTRRAMRVDAVRPAGLTGKGVGIAVVDSGIDATHPDLADHVTHNVKLLPLTDLAPEDARDLARPLVVPVDAGPRSNSDTTSGHGTAVAGVAAADGTTSPEQTGVAPDAHLIGYGAGDSEALTAVLTAYDHILEHHEAWDIDIVNNSFTGGTMPFDPDEPLTVATRALHDAGLVVLFAAGNTASEGSVSPYSIAPWVLSVGATDDGRQRAPFSSGGLRADNSDGQPLGESGHVRTEGDRLGLYHPDVMAPGAAVVTSGWPAGGTTTTSGTSFASPHVAGLAALVLQAAPHLSPADVEDVLVGSAVPLDGDEPLWRSGFGFADAATAVALATEQPARVRAAVAAAERRVLQDRDHRVVSSETWSYAPLPATVSGLDTRTFRLDVPRGTDALHVHVRHPSDDGSGANDYLYEVTVRDAAGAVVAAGRSGASSGSIAVLQPLGPGTAFGEFTVEVVGRLGTGGDGRLVAERTLLVVSRLADQPRVGQEAPFDATGTLRAHLVPVVRGAVPAGPDGCSTRQVPSGSLSLTGPGTLCQRAVTAYAALDTVPQDGAFQSAPLTQDTTFGGRLRLSLVAAAPTAPTTAVAFPPVVDVGLVAVGPGGSRTVLLTHRSAPTPIGTTPTPVHVDADLRTVTVPAGSSLRLEVAVKSFTVTATELLYGGRFGDAALTLQTGRPS